MQPDAEAFVGALRPAVRKAASIARALEGRVRNRPKSGEASDAKAALTLADSAAQEAILIPLHAGFPGLGLVAEEDTPSVGRFPARSDARVVVDPIDGTLRSYLDGSGPYAVMVGLSVAGQYEAALVGLPREDLYFDAVRGQGAQVATAAGRPHPVELDPAGRRVMISYDAPPAAAAYLLKRDYQPVPGCGGAIAVAPCIPGFCGGLRLANRPQGISP
ncbi:MAG: inositol monophosphatase family protein, partial [Myxococcota bacterium]